MAASVMIARSPGVLLVAKGTARNVTALSSSEYKFAGILALALCLFTSIPYILGGLTHVPGKQFNGVLSHSLDANNYLAYVQQSASGAWLFRNPMTPEPHSAVFLNLEWLAAGKIARVLRISPASAINIERLLCLCLMCFAVYWLAAHLFNSVAVRRVATVAAVTGGGFGWIAAVHVLHVPLDSSYFLDLTNGNLFPFYWALKLPHFLISESFVVLGMVLLVHAEQTHKTRHFLFAGLSYAAAGMCRPYDMLYAMLATTLFLIIRTARQRDFARLRQRACPVLICAPVLAYYFWIFKLHPVFHWWSFPGNPAPGPWLLALSYGPSFLIFVYALSKIERQSLGVPGQFLMCCFVTAAALAYAHQWFHFAFQFATNIFIPMLMLAFVFLENPMTRWASRLRWSNVLLFAVLIVNSLTSLALTAQAVWLVKSGDFQTDSAVLRAYQWLSDRSRPGEIVLADLDYSNELPQYTRNVTFCGYINAVEFSHKSEQVKYFLDPQVADEFRQRLLLQYNVKYILLTPEEYRVLASASRGAFLTTAFRNQAAVILSSEHGSVNAGL